jgi:hypothetical protein
LSTVGIAGAGSVAVHFWGDHRGSAQRGRHGLGAHAGLLTGTVDQELLARNEYLTAENRILKAQLNGRLKLSDAERSTLGEIRSSGTACAAGAQPGPECVFGALAKRRPSTTLGMAGAAGLYRRAGLTRWGNYSGSLGVARVRHCPTFELSPSPVPNIQSLHSCHTRSFWFVFKGLGPV